MGDIYLDRLIIRQTGRSFVQRNWWISRSPVPVRLLPAVIEEAVRPLQSRNPLAEERHYVRL